MSTAATHRAGRRKSTYSDQANGCLEVDFITSGVVGLSDSKLVDSPVILFTLGQWTNWLAEVAADELTSANGAVTVTSRPNAWTVCELATGTTLIFTDAEWIAFRLGAQDGQFTPSIPLPVSTR
ncbi:MAG: DUF397 domain-containing protein [Pseudonocardia sp.]